MKLITANGLAKTVAARWAEAYKNYRSQIPGDVDDKREITHKLSELKNPTPEKVKAIIGNGSWTDIYCFECGQNALAKAVEFDNAFGDDETETFTLCLLCVKDANKLENAGSTELTGAAT